jgi:hypothetical protein
MYSYHQAPPTFLILPQCFCKETELLRVLTIVISFDNNIVVIMLRKEEGRREITEIMIFE